MLLLTHGDADNNVVGHVAAILAVCRGPVWGEVGAALGFVVHHFEGLGIPRDLSDADLWRVCQGNNILLITANRNNTGPDSLEATPSARRRRALSPLDWRLNLKRL